MAWRESPETQASAERGALPDVLVVHLGHRDLEAARARFSLRPFRTCRLPLSEPDVRQVQLHRPQRDPRCRHAASEPPSTLERPRDLLGA